MNERTQEPIPLHRCSGPCRRILPRTAEHFPRAGQRADGSIRLRGECLDCRRAYKRREYRRVRMLKRWEQAGRSREEIARAKRQHLEMEYVITLCRDLNRDGLSLREWLEYLVVDRLNEDRRVATRLTKDLIDLLLRSFARTEEYLLLLAGEEPVERSRLIAGEELDEI